MLVLIADDKKDDSKLLKEGLEDVGFQTNLVSSAKEALRNIRKSKYDLAIIDWLFPREAIDGIDIIRAIRSLYPRTPIIMLTAKTAAGHLNQGLSCGANIYIKKPFLLAEVISYAKSMTGNFQQEKKDTVLKNGVLELDTTCRKLMFRGRRLRLDNKKFLILRYLLSQKGEVVPRYELITKVWEDANLEVNDNTLNVHINNLRNLLGGYGSRYLVTIRGVGYKLERCGVGT